MTPPIGAGFGTMYDGPADVLVPPAVVDTGHTPGLQVTDQVYRGTRVAGRLASSGLVGLKARVEGEGVRVRVRVSVDAKSVRQWDRRVGTPVDAGQLPRLLLVRSQGRLRQSVLLDPRFGGRPHAWAVFDLAPTEVPDDGLLLIELLDAADTPWASPDLLATLKGRIAPSAATGVRIDQIELLPLDTPTDVRPQADDADGQAVVAGPVDGRTCEAANLVSAGGVPRRTKPGPRVLDAGLMVVNPGGGPLTLRFGVHKGRPARRVVFPPPESEEATPEDGEQQPTRGEKGRLRPAADKDRPRRSKDGERSGTEKDDEGSAVEKSKDRPRAGGEKGRRRSGGRKGRRRGRRGRALWRRLLGRVLRVFRTMRRKTAKRLRVAGKWWRATLLLLRRAVPPEPWVLSLADGTAVPATVTRQGSALYLEIAVTSTAPLLVATEPGPGPAPVLEWVRFR
ncbi:hypothetical protein [Streptosporangium sp. KLBMP 9127]|nr:hypothetical protein [Streptosporangium sp. KLBMP 9127]